MQGKNLPIEKNKTIKTVRCTEEERQEAELFMRYCKFLCENSPWFKEVKKISGFEYAGRPISSRNVLKILRYKSLILKRLGWLNEMDQRARYVANHLTLLAIRYYLQSGGGTAYVMKTKVGKYTQKFLDRYPDKINIIYPMLDQDKIYGRTAIMAMFNGTTGGTIYNVSKAKTKY